ncbi:cadherin-7-like [Ambystoma mexicanum]|uniref:cadherin-7-like n=1 Tax=Ambystoma mexicanum TaxID=8296 RepID=UPI0037E7A279
MRDAILLLTLLGIAKLSSCHSISTAIPNSRQPKRSHTSPLRMKRGWVWNQFYVLEEQEITTPLHVGQLKSDSDKQDGTYKYVLSGDGAGNIFTIDEHSGVIYLIKKLDREEKASYTLRAQAKNRNTNLPVEPESEFIIKVQDVNDNEPQFLNGPYIATVPEMSPEGTSVIQVTAIDLDDPTYGNSARLIYSLLNGQPYFSVEPKTGVIRVASQMDREAEEQYFVIIQAKDMVGQMGGLSATATVTINLSDVNDNGPKFQQKLYHLSILESSPVGAHVGTIMADDSDIGVNAEMKYVFEKGDGLNVFDIVTDNRTQEGIVVLKKAVNYESKRMYSVRVKATNRHIDERFMDDGQFEDTSTIKISVDDADEPPYFIAPEYVMQVLEGAHSGAFVGAVSARDPDNSNSPIRYSLVRSKDSYRFFSIDGQNGTITVLKPLDREVTAWHNITVRATEAKNTAQFSEAKVYIRVVDVNDHAPEFARRYDTYICENTKPGQMIQTISAVDKDDPVEGHQFYFKEAADVTNSTNFTIRDNRDNTAAILSRRDSYSYTEQHTFLLLVVITDNGTPSLSSTNTLTISVCDCDLDGNPKTCHRGASIFSMGSNIGILLAVLACAFMLLVLVLLTLAVRQRRKLSQFAEKGEGFRENIVRYDDEGGGEEDTEAFDIAALRPRAVMRPHKKRRQITTEIQSLYRMSLRLGPDSDVFREFIKEKLEEANSDPSAPPFDCLQKYSYEGHGSTAGSLSSLGSFHSDLDLSCDQVAQWGPQFTELANIYRVKKTQEEPVVHMQ